MISTDPVHHTSGFHIPLNNFLMTAEQGSTVEDTVGCSQSACGILQPTASCLTNQSCKFSNTHITSVYNIYRFAYDTYIIQKRKENGL